VLLGFFIGVVSCFWLDVGLILMVCYLRCRLFGCVSCCCGVCVIGGDLRLMWLVIVVVS